jgi:hypothetical protein
VSCPAHAEVALQVARALGADGEVDLRSELAPADAHTELEAVRAYCASFSAGQWLLLPDVLRERSGDPAGIALAAAAAAEAAGLAVDVVGDGEQLYLAHPDTPLVIEPGSARILDGHTLGADLLWRCAHETSATVLDRVAERAERTGDLALALAARALTLELPLEGDAHEREHRRLLARLN